MLPPSLPAHLPSQVRITSTAPRTNPTSDSDGGMLIVALDSVDVTGARINFDDTAQKNNPAPVLPSAHSDIFSRLDEILDVLKDSTIAMKGGKDIRSKFWDTHRRVAEEREGEFLERHNSDTDIALVFSGLFSAVNTSFIVAMGTNLVPDPSDTTNALLTQLVYIGLGNSSAAGTMPAAPALTWSPSPTDIWIQTVAYASLSMSLLAALGAALGKQWLSYYKASRYGHGSLEDRGRRRQMKMNGLNVWYFDAIVQSFPMLLQFSLLLFGISISADIWHKQHSVAWVLIATVAFGILFYALAILASLSSVACPYQTPLSAVLRMWGVDKLLQPTFRWIVRSVQRTRWFVRNYPRVIRKVLLHSQALIILIYIVWGPPVFLWHLTKPVISPCIAYTTALTTRLWSFARQSLSRSAALDEEAYLSLTVSDRTSIDILSLDIPDASPWSSDTPAVKWLLDTSTDPEVIIAAAGLVPEIEWPLHLDISYILYQLRDTFMTCFDVQGQLVSRSKEGATICAAALNHMYCENLPRLGLRGLYNTKPDRRMFERSWKSIETLDGNLSATSVLGLGRWILGDHDVTKLLSKLERRDSDIPLVWLSHILPYCMLIEKNHAPELASLGTYVIDTLLSSAPSDRIIANCALLACQILGYTFEWKVVARTDKSVATRNISTTLAVQLQRLLCPNSVEQPRLHRLLDNTSQKQKFLRNIFNLFHLVPYDARFLKREFIARNIDYCREVYGQARSDVARASNWDSDVRSILRFIMSVGFQSIQSEQLDVWSWDRCQSSSEEDTQSFNNLSWLVDYLDGLRNADDHEVVTHVLLVLSGVRQLGNLMEPQSTYIKSLLYFMQSEQPRRVRHAALRAAHDARSALASINFSEDEVLPSINILLSGEKPFKAIRDLRFVRLVFTLAKNSAWRRHLVRNDCVTRCVAIIGPSLRCHQHPFYLTGFFFRVAPSGITDEQWHHLTRSAWYATAVTNILLVDDDAVEFLPDLVAGTKQHLIDGCSSKDILIGLDGHLARAVKMLERRVQKQKDPSPERAHTQDIISRVVGFKGVVREALK